MKKNRERIKKWSVEQTCTLLSKHLLLAPDAVALTARELVRVQAHALPSIEVAFKVLDGNIPVGVRVR